jgi:superoxide dismutase, Cu-Zn family
VMEDGSAEMSVLTDRATMDDLLADDGAAFIIHADPDNHAHIPERYADEPDEETLETGDAGDRLACGVVTE